MARSFLCLIVTSIIWLERTVFFFLLSKERPWDQRGLLLRQIQLQPEPESNKSTSLSSSHRRRPAPGSRTIPANQCSPTHTQSWSVNRGSHPAPSNQDTPPSLWFPSGLWWRRARQVLQGTSAGWPCGEGLRTHLARPSKDLLEHRVSIATLTFGHSWKRFNKWYKYVIFNDCQKI